MGDQTGANAKFAAPHDDGTPAVPEVAVAVRSTTLERWVLNYGELEGCQAVPAQRSEMSCTG